MNEVCSLIYERRSQVTEDTFKCDLLIHCNTFFFLIPAPSGKTMLHWKAAVSWWGFLGRLSSCLVMLSLLWVTHTHRRWEENHSEGPGFVRTQTHTCINLSAAGQLFMAVKWRPSRKGSFQMGLPWNRPNSCPDERTHCCLVWNRLFIPTYPSLVLSIFT